MLFKVTALDDPLWKTQYYAIRVEFQVRGSPHIHSFIWILNAPKLTKFNIDEFIKWVDSIEGQIYQTQSMNQYCLKLLKHTKYIIIQRLQGKTETKSAGFILVNFLQLVPLLLNH